MKQIITTIILLMSLTNCFAQTKNKKQKSNVLCAKPIAINNEKNRICNLLISKINPIKNFKDSSKSINNFIKNKMPCCFCSTKKETILYYIVDSKNNPLKDVYIIWGINKYGFTDSLGRIVIAQTENLDSISFSKLGFEKKKIKYKFCGDTLIRKIVLNEKKLEEVVLNCGEFCRCKRCCYTRFRITNITLTKKKTETPKLSFSLYPNPIQKNGLLNVKLEKTGNYKLEVFDMLGKVLITSSINNETKNNYQIQLNNNMLAGNYFMKLTNIETKEMIVEKFIVQ